MATMCLQLARTAHVCCSLQDVMLFGLVRTMAPGDKREDGRGWYSGVCELATSDTVPTALGHAHCVPLY